MSASARWLSSIRTRLVLGYALVVVVLASSWALSLFGPLTQATLSQQEDSLRSSANAGTIALEAGLEAQVVADSIVEGSDLRATIIAADGSVLADSEVDAHIMEDHGERPEFVDALRDGSGSDTRVSATQDVEQLYVAVRTDGGEGTTVVRVSRSLERIEAIAGRARTSGLALLGTALLVSLLVAYRLSSQSAEPIRKLTATARAIAGGDLTTHVPDVGGELGALSAALRHLSAEVRERIAENETEKRDLRTVLNGLEDAVFLLESGIVRLSNRAAAELFSNRTTEGGSIGDIALPASLAAEISERLGSDDLDTWEWGPDPLNRYMRVTLLPLSSETDTTRRLLVVSDITELRRLDRVRRDFVSNASHELKTPTAGIQLLAESAASAADDGETADALTFVRQIEEESGRLRQLVGDLLDLSRLETTPSSGAVTDIRHSIDISMTSHRISADERGLEIVADLSAIGGQDVFAFADPTDVAIALDNLLDNAVAYTEQGTILVRPSVSDTTVSIAIVDSGIGIPEEDLGRVFERFYRVDPARTRQTGGTGLGLSLVRHSVQRSGGTVTVESTVGSGTTATISLRRAS